jgi:hypothetical protein
MLSRRVNSHCAPILASTRERVTTHANVALQQPYFPWAWRLIGYQELECIASPAPFAIGDNDDCFALYA